jgi:hypothetical protein
MHYHPSQGKGSSDLSPLKRLHNLLSRSSYRMDPLEVLTPGLFILRLARVILTCNSIDKINFPPNLNCREGTSDRRDNTAPGKVHARLSSVRHLGLHSNRISRWDDIDALWKWTPGLESLSLGGNPLAEGMMQSPLSSGQLPWLAASTANPRNSRN